MDRVGETWISSTMATEMVSLAAARATLRVMGERQLPQHLQRTGKRLMSGLDRIAAQHPELPLRVRGVPELCYLDFGDAARSYRIAVGCARRGLLWKRGAYNFVSLAHDDDAIDEALGLLGDTVAQDAREHQE